MSKRNILVHLHPDFDEALAPILKGWNQVQKVVKFIGIRPRREYAVKLLTKGTIKSRNFFPILAKMRSEAGFSPDDEMIAFTEKKINDKEYGQLYYDGTFSNEKPPNLTLVSLSFARKEFSKLGKDKNMVFQTILMNIIGSLAQSDGLDSHDETRGCPLDFCDWMPDILEGIKNDFKFCSECGKQIKKGNKTYLVKLGNAVKKFGPTKAESKVVSTRIMSKNKARLKEKESKFNYDIALSYAGEDRRMVKQVANMLVKKKVKIFYDQYEKSNLLGKDLYSYLTDVYMRAKYCAMFLSKSYAKSHWTNLERQVAQASAFTMNREYILPVRFDGTKIPGFLPTIAYLDWKSEGAEGVTTVLVEKLENYET